MSLAETLHAARLAGAAVTVPEAEFPADEAGVIAVQEETLRIAGLAAGGWKAGPPPPGMLDTGCAALPAQWTHSSTATVTAPGAPLLLESEFVLRFARTLPPARAPFTAESVAEFIDAVAPGIELVWRRTANPAGPATALLYQADANGHAAMILGDWHRDWRRFDLGRHSVTQHVNGAVHARGDSGRVMGGYPLQVAAALANREARRGRAIEAGCWVTTGSCTGALEIHPGDRVRSEYGELGAVEVRIA